MIPILISYYGVASTVAMEIKDLFMKESSYSTWMIVLMLFNLAILIPCAFFIKRDKEGKGNEGTDMVLVQVDKYGLQTFIILEVCLLLFIFLDGQLLDPSGWASSLILIAVLANVFLPYIFVKWIAPRMKNQISVTDISKGQITKSKM